MAKIIMNGDGIVVNESQNVAINQGPAAAGDFALLEEQLTAVLACYRARGAKAAEIASLEGAKNAAHARDEGKLKAALKKLGGTAVNLAKELGLALLADYIVRNAAL
ncbi:MAG: hypothetical protein LBU47_05705 [Christensenellaceae bacterium]|jgi:hypothetical protein|nr:hypothetical protein [Christensenellaceae bacterium]